MQITKTDIASRLLAPISRACAATTLALCMGTAAHAAVVYDNGAPDRISGVNMNANAVAEDFTLAAGTTLTNIRFWSLMGAPGDYSGTIGWRILTDAGGGVPGATVVASGSVSPALNPTGSNSIFGAEEYVFDIGLSAFLSAGNYWLELSGLTLDPINPTDMLWETTLTGQGASAQYFDAFSGDWVDSLQNLAFVLSDGGVVNNTPEPTSLALVGLALAAAGTLRRKA